jgi:hypothetical protein
MKENRNNSKLRPDCLVGSPTQQLMFATPRVLYFEILFYLLMTWPERPENWNWAPLMEAEIILSFKRNWRESWVLLVPIECTIISVLSLRKSVIFSDSLIRSIRLIGTIGSTSDNQSKCPYLDCYTCASVVVLQKQTAINIVTSTNPVVTRPQKIGGRYHRMRLQFPSHDMRTRLFLSRQVRQKLKNSSLYVKDLQICRAHAHSKL